jgi:atypical dual specificity phosphatase
MEEFDEKNFILRNFSFILENKLAGCHKPGMSPSNLKNDLKILKEKGITLVLSMSDMKLDEKVIKEEGMKNVYFSVKDYYPPSQEQMLEMVSLVNQNEGATVIHCNAGQGRTGTMLAAYLICLNLICVNFSAKGMPAEEAITKLRSLRKGSIQTFKQEDALKLFEKTIKDQK